MRDLKFQIVRMCARNADGSFATRADRLRILSQCADRLEDLGYRNMQAASLKPKHVEALLASWREEGISTGSIKNRMSAIRYWAEKIGKQNVVAASNSAYGIEHRVYVGQASKALRLGAGQLALVKDPYTRAALALQAAFGLRREESIKIQPDLADRGAMLYVKASWAKGGRAREIPIGTPEQRTALDAARALAQGGSLIPVHLRYRDQLQRFRAQCDKAGIHHVHGLRHAYAQGRYRELTGRPCPHAGGPISAQLTPVQKERDRAARLTISAELGHGREQVTSIYLGR